MFILPPKDLSVPKTNLEAKLIAKYPNKMRATRKPSYKSSQHLQILSAGPVRRNGNRLL